MDIDATLTKLKLASPDKAAAQRKEIIEKFSCVKKTAPEVIQCPTLPPPLQINEWPSNSSLGSLDILPLELLHMIFQFSNLESLSFLRRLNRRSRFLLNNWPVYSTLLEHVPKALLIFSRTNSASYFTAKQVRDVLYTSECSVCGSFGSYLYLPHCKRCCFRCVKQRMELSTITSFSVTKHYISRGHLSKEALSNIRFVSTIRTESNGTQLLACHADIYGTAQHTKKYILWAQHMFQRRCDAQSLEEETHGRAGQVTMPFPYLNQSTGVREHAILCRACSIHARKITNACRPIMGSKMIIGEMEYSEEGLIRHLENCDGHAPWM